ncbi:MAG: protein translocase subunit SecF [Prochlorococcus sp. SP3034]|nr:protein translocase subunit SecF [Prochlorococcus sp. SP3034]
MKFFNLIKNKKIIFSISSLLLGLSLIGIIISTLSPSIKKPINLGMDFLGGNEIRIERECLNECSVIRSDQLVKNIRNISNNNLLNNISFQIQNNNKLISIRTPFISLEESENLLKDINNVVGPLNFESKSSRSIGPKLGKKLLINGGISLIVSLLAISLYLSIRFDNKFALLALAALFHDLFIVFGIFSWLGIILSVEVNSLFAVSLLTIAGYSVNDTVVIFDRIRENIRLNDKNQINENIELSVNESLRRTLFTSLTTLIPLSTLILFGSYTLFWFSVSLALGIIIGSYSSILLAPCLLLEDN